MLSMAPALLRQRSSCAMVTAAGRDPGCDPWSIHQPRPPYQTGVPISAGGVRIRGGGLLRHVAILYIRGQWRDPEISIFCSKIVLRKFGRMLKTLVPKFLSDLSASLQGVDEKQVPRS